MKKTDEPAPAESGRIELTIGVEQYAGLAITGFLGMLPLVVWGGGLAMLMEAHEASPASSGGTSMVGEISGVLLFVALIATPSLVSCLVLRARQRKGAFVEWDGEGVTEWDGPWKRNAIPWSRMEAAIFSWRAASSKSPRANYQALQMRDREASAVITIWQVRPDEAPVVRRRLISNALPRFVEMLRARQVPFSGVVDWSHVEERERRRFTGWKLWLARSGYIGALCGPMIAFPSPVPGMMISVVAAALLAWRALPVLHELKVVRSRLHAFAQPIAKSPAILEAPYREPAAHESEKIETREAADRIRLPAVWVEALLRLSLGALTLVAAWANGFYGNR
ncbi:MAG: hypothetical protein ABI461_11565 [Polyangiaceae bacterium]